MILQNHLLGLSPICRHMADTTICAIGAVMLVLIRVTGNTLGWRTLINTVSMAFRTTQICMFAFERKIRITVVESRIAPSTGVMA